MGWGPVRPRFVMELGVSPDRLRSAFTHAVETAASTFVMRTVGTHMDITVVRDIRHFWSPCVHLEFEPKDDGTRLRGLYGPHPNVWTMFAFLTLSTLVLMSFGAIGGMAEWMANGTAWSLVSLPFGAAILIGQYVMSQWGQRRAEETDGVVATHGGLGGGRRGIMISILRVILSYLIPPLGVFFTVGIGLHFWINIVLTLCGYIPGLIHAIWIIAKRA